MNLLGIDEVGRGPWAGPLVVGACVLKSPIEGLTDSKKLSAKRRKELSEIIWQQAACGLGWISAAELDEIGLSQALMRATRAAVAQINFPYHEIVIDGTVNFLRETKLAPYVQVLKKADFLVPAVSAASIIAKVARDEYMIKLAETYPAYGFEKHVGYGTALHHAAILQNGICPEHRKSFRPIADYLAQSQVGAASISPTTAPKNTTAVGQKAETIVANFLTQNHHKILARNWKNRFCEIDIVSEKANVVYFTEVKYRRNCRLNDGIDAVDARKQQQMRFAAELYLKDSGLTNQKATLAVASVSGDNYQITDFRVLP